MRKFDTRVVLSMSEEPWTGCRAHVSRIRDQEDDHHRPVSDRTAQGKNDVHLILYYGQAVCYMGFWYMMRLQQRGATNTRDISQKRLSHVEEKA